MGKFFQSKTSVSGQSSSTNLVGEDISSEDPSHPSHQQIDHRRKSTTESSTNAVNQNQGISNPSFNPPMSSTSSAIEPQLSDSPSQKPSYAVSVGRNKAQTLFPILNWISNYPIKKYFLFGDLPAGIYIGLFQIPQCMAYAILAEVPAVHAIYTTLFASVVYTLFGSHRRLSHGIFALVSALYMGILVDRIRPRFSKTVPFDPIALIGMTTFLTGLYSIAGSVFRLGSLVRFLPYEVLSGLRAGVALLIFSLQLNSILGIDAVQVMDPGDGVSLLTLPRLYGNQLYPHLAHNINWHAVLISAGCFACLALARLIVHYWAQLFGPNRLPLLKNLLRLIPVEFILVAIGFVLCYKLDLSQYQLILVGHNGTGNNSLVELAHLQPQWPQFKLYFHLVWSQCITATMLTLVYAHSVAIDLNVADTEVRQSKTGAKPNRGKIDPSRVQYVRFGWNSYHPNRELLTQGFANLVGSFCKCLPAGVSATRSYRLRNVGGKSQISAIISSLTIGVVWWSLHQYLGHTPRCVVASIVAFDSLLAMKQEVLQLKHYWSVSSIDLLVWILAISSFIFLNLDYSLYVCLALGVAVYVFRSGLFAGFRFQRQRSILTNDGGTLIVSESVLQQQHSNSKPFDFNDNNPDDEEKVEIGHQLFNDEPGRMSVTNFMSMPECRLRDIEIFRLEQKSLTIGNLDSFVRDVFRQITTAVRTKPKQRMIFDCRHLSYMDWTSVRTVKATLMRSIEIADSMRSAASVAGTASDKQPISAFGNGTNQRIDTHVSRPMIIAFVFPTKMVQLIHNAGQFNVRFYHSLHKSLHMGLRSAIYSMVSYDDDYSGNSDGGGGGDYLATNKNNNGNNSQKPPGKQNANLGAHFPDPNNQNNQGYTSLELTAIDHSHNGSRSPGLSRATNQRHQRQPSTGYDGSEKVFPLAFRPNDNEFSYTSSYGSRSTASNRSKRSKILMEELFEPFNPNSSGPSGSNSPMPKPKRSQSPVISQPVAAQQSSQSLPRFESSSNPIPYFHNPISARNIETFQSKPPPVSSAPQTVPIVVITEPPRVTSQKAPPPPPPIRTTSSIAALPSPPPLPLPPQPPQPPQPTSSSQTNSIPSQPLKQTAGPSKTQSPPPPKPSQSPQPAQPPQASKLPSSPNTTSSIPPPPPPPPPPPSVVDKYQQKKPNSPTIKVKPWTGSLPKRERSSSRPSLGIVPSFRTKLENMLRNKTIKIEFDKSQDQTPKKAVEKSETTEKPEINGGDIDSDNLNDDETFV